MIKNSKLSRNENNHYVYIHYTLDENIPYYIGKGRDSDSSFKRAFDYGKNNYWKNVTNKHGRKVEILHTNLTEIEAFNYEKLYR